MKLPHAGTLNTRGTLQKAITVQDDNGQPIETWLTVRTVWISVEYASGKEETRGNQIEPIHTHNVWMRYAADISTQWRIGLSGNRTLNILSAADPDNQRTWLACQCLEVPS